MKQLPFDLALVQEIIKSHPTPFYLYDEAGIRGSAKSLTGSFGWAAT